MEPSGVSGPLPLFLPGWAYSRLWGSLKAVGPS